MDHIGIDVPKRESQIYILARGGEVVEPRIRIVEGAYRLTGLSAPHRVHGRVGRRLPCSSRQTGVTRSPDPPAPIATA